MEVISLFSTPIFAEIIEDNNLIKELDNLSEKYDYHDVSKNCFQGQHMRILKYLPKAEQLFLNKFNDLVNRFLFYDSKFEISTSWMTKTCNQGIGEWHCHKNSFYSGVYYFGDYDSESAEIEFRNPLKDVSSYLIECTEYNEINSGQWHIPAQRGKIIFFPSTLYHRIGAHNSHKMRKSIAFNIVPVGFYGNRYDSTYDTSWFS
jgi:uncharacterized protein (TIGR02466 family)|tara:strand:- start:51 stop:662 length:612 start_codon:yes stop_codon:yes gene_type:complete